MADSAPVLIPDLEHELQELGCRLEDAKHVFLATSAGFLASWYWQAILKLVAEQQHVTHTLDPHALACLRAEIRTLQTAAHTTVLATVGLDRNWWHKQPKDQWYTAAPGTLPEWLIPRFEQAAAELGVVTRKYGYADDPRRYALHGVVFPPDLVASINRYGELKHAAEKVKHRLDLLKRTNPPGAPAEPA